MPIETMPKKGKSDKFPDPFAGLSKKEQHFLLYLAIILIALLIFQPGLILGLLIGALGYKYYLDHLKG